MNKYRTIGIILLGLILMATNACSSDDKEATGQTSTGDDASVTITAVGDIEASLRMELTFGSGGKVDQIFVSTGDEVTEGDVLAKLDTAPLEMSLTQSQVTQAQVQISQAQAQTVVTQAEIARTQAQAALIQAHVGLAQAKANQGQAKITLNKAEEELEDAYSYLRWARRTFNTSDAALEDAEMEYETAHLELQIAESQIEATELQIEAAELQVEASVSQTGVVEAQLEIAVSQIGVADLQFEAAEQAIAAAKKQLNEATITAPFDGIISNIWVKEGEFISPATFTGITIVEVTDLENMELITIVDEFDIAKVKTGQIAVISVDAMPEMKLEGQVTFISPVNSEPAGIVLFESDDDVKEYEVKIEFDVGGDFPVKVGMSATAEIIVE
ncbi:HlyD family secretion protein [Chloroflexota bacterium]